MTNTLNQNIFFSNIGNQNIFFLNHSFLRVLRILPNKTDRHHIIDILFLSDVKHHNTNPKFQCVVGARVAQ